VVNRRVLPFAVRAGAVAVGLVGDRLLREPPNRFHPVAWFGTAMTQAEERFYADDRQRGVVHAAVGAGLGALAGLALRRVVGSVVATATATAVTVGGRLLTDEARQIAAQLTAGDLEGARARLPALVGRDPTGLGEAEIARAVVESVAENTVDALVAPVVWAVAGGAAATTAYRAINTMDAMVGHHSPRYERYGWAAARLDDLAGWVPARLTAAIVAALRPGRARAIWRAVHDDAPLHPSPNAGVVEAAFAAALGLRLGGANVYAGRVEERAALGQGAPPTPADVEGAVTLSRQVANALAGALALVAVTSFVTRMFGVRRRSGGSLAPWPATSSTRSG
jgi:adenosylcobinamide-phosphate synthase